MAAQLLLLLLCAQVLLSTAGGQEDHRGPLPGDYQRGVDLTLEMLESRAGVQHQFVFLKSVTRSTVESGFDVSFVYHNFYLKATTCPTGTEDRRQCHFRNDIPLLDCAICYKTFAGGIEPIPKPYLNCMYKPAITEEIKTVRIKHCKEMSYMNGSATLAGSTGEA